MGKKRRHNSKPQEPSQEQLVADHRRRCRGPEWWQRYSNEEIAQFQAAGRRLREEGYGCDEEFCSWLELYGQK